MATFYINPDLDTNGTGTIGSPYNTWAGVTLTANNTYLQRRNTTYIGAAVRPQSQVSSANTPLTIGAYSNDVTGEDDNPSLPKPIINHNGGTNGVGAVFIDTCNYIVVANIAGTKSSAALGGGITVRRSQNWKIQYCEAYDNEHGICIQQDQASGTSTCTDGTVENCVLYNNVSAGITFRWGAVATAVLKRITIKNNTVYANGTGKEIGAGSVSVPCGGIQSYSVYKTDTNVNYRNYDLELTGNTVYANNGYGINVEMWDNEQKTSLVAYNTVYGNGRSLDVDSHSVWIGNCFNVRVEGNFIYNNFAKKDGNAGSGVGIFVDFNGVSPTGGDGCVITRNYIRDQYSGSTNVTFGASSGIFVFFNTNTKVFNNIIVNCRYGISVGTGAASCDNCSIKHNTIVNTTAWGIGVYTQATNALVSHNIITGGTLGLYKNTSGTAGFIENYNNIFGAAVLFADGTTSAPTPATQDATDIIGDPKLTSDLIPRASSNIQHAGLHSKYLIDFHGVSYNNPPSIGAIEYIAPRGTRT